MNATDLVLRMLQPQDTTAVAQLMSEHALWSDRDRMEQNRRLAHLLDRGEYGLIAEYSEGDDRVVAGFAIMSDGTFGDHGYIRLFGIRERLTGRRIGTRLLHAAEELFVQRQIHRAFLLCTDWNTGAQSFYERHGYERVGILPEWLEAGVNQLIYAKRDLDAHQEEPVQPASQRQAPVNDQAFNGGSMRVAGLISGTSVDAIDVAVCEFIPASDEDPNTLEMSLVCFREQPMPTSIRQRLLAMLDLQTADLVDLTELNVVLGAAFADALLATLRDEGLRIGDIDLIASHGQTIYYLNDGVHARSTLQMGEPAEIAKRAGVSVMADFRVADVAAGGLGAPLVSYFDALFFGGRGTARALQNIGGIGNVTFIPATRAVEDAYAFDTGPGNVLVDCGARHFSRGTANYDADGAMARRGRVHAELLEEALAHPYFAEMPPKATGRELFGDSFAAELISHAQGAELSPEDTMATLTAITAESIARAYRAFGPNNLSEVVLAGGGARNSCLVDQLRNRLPDIRVRMHDEFGVPAAAKEAVAFALLGYDGLRGRTTNMPRCTGAREAVTLGKLVPGKNYRALLSRIVAEMTTEWHQQENSSASRDRVVRLKQLA